MPSANGRDPHASSEASGTAPPSVAVVGLGYVGLPLALFLAEQGFRVLGVDTNQAVLDAIARGEPRIGEPTLDQRLHEAALADRLELSTAPHPADYYVIAVPTPLRGLADKTADLSAVEAALDGVGRVLRRGATVIIESTCPPNTTERVARPLLERVSGLRAGADFSLAYCPERILPGQIEHELAHNDRIVGGIDRASSERARSLYASFVRGELHVTDATTAELVKLMENTYRDVNIALANEFALVGEHLGVDVWRAIELANRHPRVSLLRPGPGVGGHCIAVDPWFVVGAAPHFTPLISNARRVNDAMPGHVAELVVSALDAAHGRRVVALGLTYKADVSDVRESPAADVIERLEGLGVVVSVHDAVVRRDEPVAALAAGADCLLLLVDHSDYRALQPEQLAPVMRTRVVVDTRNMLDVGRWRAAGFRVVRLGDGRSSVDARRLSAGAISGR